MVLRCFPQLGKGRRSKRYYYLNQGRDTEFYKVKNINETFEDKISSKIKEKNKEKI